MERMTIAKKDGRYSVSTDEIECGEETCTGPAIDRLAAYEDMHEAVELQYQQAAEKLEKFKAQGNLKSTTAQTLIAQKLTFANMLGLIDLHR